MDFKKQYLTHEKYKELGGSLKEMPFNIIEFRARKIIDKYTFGRLIDLDKQRDEVKLCTNTLINEIYNYNTISNKSSESVGSYSVSFSKPATKEQEQVYKNIVSDYLVMCKLEDKTPYMYCGVGR